MRGAPDTWEGTGNSYLCGGMLKPLEQIPMAFLGQVSSVSPGNVDFAFESERQP